ncbi:MAG: sigma-54 dependent transcriptional regulator [Deltaproteobacteria bacterium]|nr:sigma-54 dependent transcriptional regulator [Deltaproteobacteria bacterium]
MLNSLPKPTLLVVDDDRAMAMMLVSSLASDTLSVLVAASPAEALDRMEHEAIDVVVTDVRMGAGMTGIELCARMHEGYPMVPVIVITAFGSLETAILAIRAGAHDFLPKPFDPDELLHRVRKALELRTLRDEVRRLRDARARHDSFDSLVGESQEMKRVFSLVDRVAQSSAIVLITGETGTGKELVAQAIHSRSRRAHGPLVVVNCAAISETLLEAELFGHTRGAFTDARQARPGLFVAANHGSIFLDEIGELSKPMQAKLLRALQERKVKPVGADTEVAFDARVIAATNRDLVSLVAEGQFREDLYFRLAVVEIDLPPLRARHNDVLILAQHFVKLMSSREERLVTGIDAECARLLLQYAWPGNVRELHNVIERAVALAQYDTLTAADLPDRIQHFKRSHVLVTAETPEEFVRLEEVERRYILRVLEATQGHRSKTAEILGLDRKTLYNRLRAYGVGDPPASLPPPPPKPV